MCNASNLARLVPACLAGLVFVILSASIGAATYGPRTKIGTAYQQTSNTQSLDGINEGNCTGAGSCAILFSVTPQQKALIVEHVSCRVNVSTGALRFGELATRQLLLQKRTLLLPIPTTGTWWVVNSPAMHLFKSGERPGVNFFNSAAADWSAECNISGTLQQ